MVHLSVPATGAINRHDYTRQEIDEGLQRPIVRRLLGLVQLRNTHPAFDGELEVEATGASDLRLTWSNGASACELLVNVATGRATVSSEGLGASTMAAVI